MHSVHGRSEGLRGGKEGDGFVGVLDGWLVGSRYCFGLDGALRLAVRLWVLLAWASVG